jgi:hypothetical protein
MGTDTDPGTNKDEEMEIDMGISRFVCLISDIGKKVIRIVDILSHSILFSLIVEVPISSSVRLSLTTNIQITWDPSASLRVRKVMDTMTFIVQFTAVEIPTPELRHHSGNI